MLVCNISQKGEKLLFSGLLLNQKKKNNKNKAWTSTLLCMATLHTVCKDRMQGWRHGSLLLTMRYSLTFLQNVSLYHYKLYAPKWDSVEVYWGIASCLSKLHHLIHFVWQNVFHPNTPYNLL